MRIRYNIRWALRRISAPFNPKRKIQDIFDYNEVIKERYDLERNIIGSNVNYGVNYILKRHSKYNKTINALVEHAPGLTNYVLNDYKNETSKTLFVCSRQRVDFLKDYTDKTVVDIGPSIAYAKCIYSDDKITEIKRKLGRTLLLYPVHNIEDTNWESDTDQFIKAAKEIRDQHKFDTVLVSMYHIDIKRGTHKRYEAEGFKVVSSGYIQNYDFNDIMKTIIHISDGAIFQAYTSAIGYCIYEKVPVMLTHNSMIHDKWQQNYTTDILYEFEKMYGEYTGTISKEQYEFANEWFGYDSVRESRELFKLLDEAYKRNRKR